MTQNPHREKLLKPHIRYVKEVIPIAKQEESNIFGESLPAGIVLHSG
jgi:hypothetical protein